MNGFQKCRIRAGLTQSEVANALHVAQGTVSAWETGKTYPVGNKVASIARLYGCSISELYAGHTPHMRRRVSRKRNIDNDNI